MRLIGFACVVLTLSAVLSSSVHACPVTRGTFAWDGLNGQLSQDSGAQVAAAVRAADDFTMPAGVSSQPWEVRSVTAEVISSYVPTAAGFGLEVFNDANRAGVGPVPGTRQYLLVGATALTDLGVAPGGRRYRVRFAVPAGALLVPASQRRWASIYATAGAPGTSFTGTAGNGVVSGEIGRANLSYPGGLWTRLDICCIGATDLAIRVRGVQTGTPQSDFNCSGITSVQDIFDFMAAYFTNSPDADFNHNGSLTVQDLFDLLAAYFAGI